MNAISIEVKMALVGALTLFLREATAWFFNRKKKTGENKAIEIENDSSELDNVDKAVAIWRQLATDLQGKLETLTENQARVLEQHAQIMKQNIELNTKVDELTKNNSKLTEHIAKLEKKVQTLTNENKKLLIELKSK